MRYWLVCHILVTTFRSIEDAVFAAKMLERQGYSSLILEKDA